MTIRRALPLVLAFVAFSFAPANAQFTGMGMGMPGSPGFGGPGMMSPGFGAQPQQSQQPPPACQHLLTLRDQTQKAAAALKAAGDKKAGAEEACKLFKVFVAAESKMIKALEDGAQVCGVPQDAIKSVKAQHVNVAKTANNVCEAAAAQGARPAGPTFSEALGSTPTVPESTSKRGYGTFDTLSGSQLVR